MTDDDSHRFDRDAADLLSRMRTLHLASVSAAAVPLASVAPFVHRGGSLYVFLSALAGHTANLRETDRVCVLVARDEVDCNDPFARPRLTLRCETSEEHRDSAVWNEVLDAMETRLGETAAVVRTLPDFTLFRLQPLEGQIVTGFARARPLDDAALSRLFAALSSPRGG